MKYKLGECIEEIVDKTTENNQYEVLSVTKDGIYSQEEFFKKQIASEDNTGYKIIRKNNLVFSTMNLWMGSLDVLSNYEIGIVSPAYKIFKFDESKMIPSFGKYFMKSHFMLEQYKNCSEQGASIVRRNLDLKQLLDTEIIIPTVEEQCKIVKVLENIDEIINKYTNLIKNKEQLIKSQFVEMFGDIKDSSKGWIKKQWKDVVLIQNGKDYKHIAVDDGGFPVYGSGGKMSRASEYLCPENTIIVGRKGSINNPLLVKEKFWNVDTAFGIITKEELNYQYFYYFCKKFDFNTLNKATTLPSTTKADLLKIEINVPPIKLQNKFADIVQLIDKQKFELEKQKQNYIDLKKGLMQQLLTGKLKVS